jgi:acyl-CoA thioesterase-1
VILELGANDALRGLPPETTRENLDAMITRLKERGIAVLLAGMLAPPNMGADYETKFNTIYPDLAKQHDLVFYPFFLDGVTGNPSLLLSDGMHPNANGINRMVEGILPYAETFLTELKACSARIKVHLQKLCACPAAHGVIRSNQIDDSGD